VTAPDGEASTEAPGAAFPDAAAEARAERFLARVAALTPAEWGRLDAIGERMAAGDLLTRFERVGQLSRFMRSLRGAMHPTGKAALAVHSVELMAVVLTMLGELRDWLRDDAFDRQLWRRMSRRRAPAGSSPRMQRHVATTNDWFERLWTIAERQPGAGMAIACLGNALVGIIASGGPMQGPMVEHFYGPVEPVIPFASLDVD
jgi:hypothetical protein